MIRMFSGELTGMLLGDWPFKLPEIEPPAEPEVKPFGDSLPANHANQRIAANANKDTLQLDSKGA